MSEVNSGSGERRDSVPHHPEPISDPVKRAEAEAANGLRQFDFGRNSAQEAIDRQSMGDYRFRLRPSLILALHREALGGISAYAGNYRPSTVKILASRHQPPNAHLVPALVEDMCEYVNDRWIDATPLHLSS